jgi:hypothetical protein
MTEKAKEHHVFFELRDKSPEAIATRKRIARLGRIIRLEHELSGEENW